MLKQSVALDEPYPMSNQVLIKDNLNIDSQEQLYHDPKNIEVNVLTRNQKEIKNVSVNPR